MKLCLDSIPLGASPVSHLTSLLIWFKLMPSDKILSNSGEKLRCSVIFARCLANFSGTDCHPETDIGNGAIGSATGTRWEGSKVSKIGRKDDGTLTSNECSVRWTSVIGRTWCSSYAFCRTRCVPYPTPLKLLSEMMSRERLDIKFQLSSMRGMTWLSMCDTPERPTQTRRSPSPSIKSFNGTMEPDVIASTANTVRKHSVVGRYIWSCSSGAPPYVP